MNYWVQISKSLKPIKYFIYMYEKPLYILEMYGLKKNVS